MDPNSPLPPSRPPSSLPPRAATIRPGASDNRHKEAAADVIRRELNTIYSGRSGQDTPHTTPVSQPSSTTSTRAEAGQKIANQEPTDSLAVTSPYDKTHSAPSLSQVEQWKQYHSSWQNYYQKYYEQYYVSAVKQQLDSATTVTSEPTTTTAPDSDGALTRDEALYELRQKIITNATTQAKKVRKSRHFIPIAAALSVVLLFALLQYNQVLIANVKAYVTPGNIAAQNIIIDPNAEVPVGPEPRMIIPKINVDAPVVMEVGPTEEEQLAAMANGIAHVRYPGASSVPGQVGNTIFSGHSSSDWTDMGDYKFIFVQLERMAVDDIIYVNYNSTRYSYKVTSMDVVMPTEIDALRYDGDKPIITLITCVPLGTAEKRLLVKAEQVGPSPDKAVARSEEPATDEQSTPQMVGTTPTLLERLFGSR